MNLNPAELNQPVPSEGSEGVLPLPRHDAPQAPNPDTDPDRERPDRAHQMGEGSYEGTDGYAKNIASYLKTADVESDAAAAAPQSKREARDMLAAEIEAASHSKAPGK